VGETERPGFTEIVRVMVTPLGTFKATITFVLFTPIATDDAIAA
jgi:hypothetical protein